MHHHKLALRFPDSLSSQAFSLVSRVLGEGGAALLSLSWPLTELLFLELVSGRINKRNSPLPGPWKLSSLFSQDEKHRLNCVL